MGKGGKMKDASKGTQPRSPTADLVHSDPRFRPFLQGDFDAASFASRALAETHTTASQQTEQLQQGIQLLDSQLRQEVSSRQAELISQAARLHDSEAALQRITLSVRSLQSVAARVRAEVADPYKQILSKSIQLRNLQRTVDLLRHAIHRIKLVQKLRAQMALENAGILEVAKAARLLSDIAAVDSEVDLAGLDVVDADAEFVAAASAQVRAQAEAALQAGLASLSQADVGSALQVLFNLGQLPGAIAARVDSAVAALERSLSAALDPRKLSAGASGKSGAGGSSVPGSAAKDVLWDRLSGVCDALHRSALEVWHLQRVLAKKRDPLSHVLLLDVVAPAEGEGGSGEEGGGELPLDAFWTRVCAALGECFATAFNTARGGFVREALIAGYPRLSALLEDVCSRVVRDSTVKDADPALIEVQALGLLEVASDFQNAYLAGSVARMSDAVQTAFPGGTRSLPTAADLQKSIARVHEELKGAGAGGTRLATLAARGVGGALHLLAEKAGQMAATGPDLRSVSGGCTPAQLRNLSLCNCLQEVHRSLAALLPRMHPAAAEELRVPLEAVQAAAVECVAPTFRAMVESAQDALLAMHKQGWGGEAPAADVTDTSPYMRTLVRHITHCRVEYLSKLNPSPSSPVPSVGRALVERMAARLLVFFVRHAALLRPLGQAGKIQLAKDMGELEAAITQHLLPMDQLGPPARILRAFRRLLFTPRETPSSAALAAAPAAAPATPPAGGEAAAGEDGADAPAAPAPAPAPPAPVGAALPASALPALLRDLPRTALLHYLFSQGPAAVESPHTRSGLTPTQYSLWLDEHSQEDAVKFIKAALEAGEAKAKGDPTLVLMKRVVAGEV